MNTLRRVSIKYYAKVNNMLSNGAAYTRAIHAYYQHLGDIQSGEYICVNNSKHPIIQIFDTVEKMRSHWASCHNIDENEILLPLNMPNLNVGPAPVLGQRVAPGTDANANMLGEANANPTGDAGPSNSATKGTTGKVSDSAKESKKGNKKGDRSSTAHQRGPRKSTLKDAKKFASVSARKILALRDDYASGDVREKEKAKIAALNEAKKLTKALADLVKEANDAGPGTQQEVEASPDVEAGPSGKEPPAQEPEGLTADSNEEKGGEEGVETMEVDLSPEYAEIAAMYGAQASEPDTTFRDKPISKK